MIRGFPKSPVFKGQIAHILSCASSLTFTPTHVKFALLFSLLMEH